MNRGLTKVNKTKISTILYVQHTVETSMPTTQERCKKDSLLEIKKKTDFGRRFLKDYFGMAVRIYCLITYIMVWQWLEMLMSVLRKH